MILRYIVYQQEFLGRWCDKALQRYTYCVYFFSLLPGPPHKCRPSLPSQSAI